MAKDKDFITLKEAAKISGYSADYLGQLIRSGKLPGKQVFSNVSWVTTEDAVVDYMKNGGRSSAVSGDDVTVPSLQRILTNEESLLAVYRYATGILGALLIVVIFILFYVSIVTFDRSIDQRYLDKAADGSF
jgi:hypothetical protein